MGAICKRMPEDFRVEEVLLPEAEDRILPTPASFRVFLLEKKELSTPEAIDRIAQKLHLPQKKIFFGGLKDKYAVTTQYLALPARVAPSETLEAERWRLIPIGWSEDPLEISWIAGNRFSITIRHLSDSHVDAIEERLDFLGTPPVFVNYFGPQRFGSERHRAGFVAKALLRGEFEEALRLAIAVEARKDWRWQKEFKRELQRQWGKWQELVASLSSCPERRAIEVLAKGGDFRRAYLALPFFLQQIHLEAYQSYLWNKIAARLIQTHFPGPYLSVKGLYGPLFHPRAGWFPHEEGMRKEGADREREEWILPLPSPKMKLKPPWGEAAREVFAEEGITAKMLRIPGTKRPYFGATPRPLGVLAKDFWLGKPETDELGTPSHSWKREISFFLPRGAYATILLQALTESSFHNSSEGHLAEPPAGREGSGHRIPLCRVWEEGRCGVHRGRRREGEGG